VAVAFLVPFSKLPATLKWVRTPEQGEPRQAKFYSLITINGSFCRNSLRPGARAGEPGAAGGGRGSSGLLAGRRNAWHLAPGGRANHVAP